MNKPKIKRERLPRDGAGSVSLDSTPGNIVKMLSFEDYIEFYKKDFTHRVRTPESIDPERRDPHAPFTVESSANVGAGHPVVAWTVLQGQETMQGLLTKSEAVKSVLQELHACKENLSACLSIEQELEENYKKVDLEYSKMDWTPGKPINPFPYIQNLDKETGSYLVHANRAIRNICQLPNRFNAEIKEHANFDHLIKNLTVLYPEPNSLRDFLERETDHVKKIIVRRNGHEHPKKNERTHVFNYRMIPNNGIMRPSIQYNDEGAEDLLAWMKTSTLYLAELAAFTTLNLAYFYCDSPFHHAVRVIKPEHRNSEMPLMFSFNITWDKSDTA